MSWEYEDLGQDGSYDYKRDGRRRHYSDHPICSYLHHIQMAFVHWRLESTPKPLSAEVGPELFSEGRAMKHVSYLSEIIGDHQVGVLSTGGFVCQGQTWTRHRYSDDLNYDKVLGIIPYLCVQTL